MVQRLGLGILMAVWLITLCGCVVVRRSEVVLIEPSYSHTRPPQPLAVGPTGNDVLVRP